MGAGAATLKVNGETAIRYTQKAHISNPDVSQKHGKIRRRKSQISQFRDVNQMRMFLSQGIRNYFPMRNVAG